MPQRFKHDLSHLTFTCGDVGKLQTMLALPVVAGDSISVNMEGIFRLSPLRRNLVTDVAVDIFGFFVPHRHVYGSDWIQFIKDGKNETETFPPAGPAIAPLDYLGTTTDTGEEFALWLSAGYNRIWNRYFRAPTDSEEKADGYMATDPAERAAGFSCGYLPVAWSTGTNTEVVQSEREVDTTGDILDITSLNRVQAEYRTEVDRNYFGVRYNDLLNTVYGATVNTDADERPTLCGRNRFWLSGYDVDGTDDASLGSYSGKSAGVGRFQMRRKYFPEHGCFWMMCLPRFPTVHTKERHPLHYNTNPSYLEISGDPALIAAEPPVNLENDQFFRDPVGGVGYGFAPYGPHYRYFPSQVHRAYQQVDGWTFVDTNLSGRNDAHYIQTDEYNEVFQTTQLRQWQASMSVNIDYLSAIPPARSSLYAGA